MIRALKQAGEDFLSKRLAYYLPLSLRGLMLPYYRFGVEPAQLACLLGLIDANNSTGGGVVCEVGVNRGYTSMFLLEHMRSTANPNTVVLVDTFNGFTEDAIIHEVRHRGKNKSDIDRFKGASPRLFSKHLRQLGYDNFKVIAGNGEEVDWAEVGPIAVALIDVDLYLPTKRTLDRIWPQIIPGGACMVDDCKRGTQWDGALQAYAEFIAEHNMPFIQVGTKGGLLRKAARPPA